jgi:alkanesulfonate monooxygenase SsuD/methylene tetrahydromethanopterin reductase-like flavin-dependent oxidoreductase (luciferase family)
MSGKPGPRNPRDPRFLPETRDLTHTREILEDVIGEFPKMFMQDEYEGYQGRYWSLPPGKILPKPWKKPHPPMWVCGRKHHRLGDGSPKGPRHPGFSVQAIL